MSTRSLADHAEAQSQRPWFRFVARAGMAGRGVIFLIIGILALKVATDSGGTTTDQSGALAALAQQPFGEVLLAILALALAGYALWRFVQGVLDTDDKGDDEKAWAVRASKVGSGVSYAILCAAAVGILMGSGGGGSSSGGPKNTTAGVLGWPGGQVWVVIASLVVFAVAGWNIYRGVAKKFMKRLHPPARMRAAVELVGVIGMCARGAVFGLIAGFLMKAALEFDPKEAVGLDGALARLAAEPYGKALLGFVAAGLVAFALYCFAEARYREV
jgi:Domain of Unknown Function (DUF1206)